MPWRCSRRWRSTTARNAAQLDRAALAGARRARPIRRARSARGTGCTRCCTARGASRRGARPSSPNRSRAGASRARALPDGVVILDDDRIGWCNDTARHHLEIDPARDAGTPITHLVRIPEFLEYLEARRLREADAGAQRRIRRARCSRCRWSRYGDEPAPRAHRATSRSSEQVERMRREFVANVSHELRTPLTVITGFLETLRDEARPGAARRYIDLMSEQAQRMQRLVEDLLTLSSLESSPPPPMEEPIDMGSLVERLGAEARALSRRAAPHRASRQRRRRALAGQREGDLERARQPREQRHSLHARGRQRAAALARRPAMGAAFDGRGHRHRHRARAHPATDASASIASTAGARARPAARGWASRS